MEIPNYYLIEITIIAEDKTYLHLVMADSSYDAENEIAAKYKIFDEKAWRIDTDKCIIKDLTL